MTVAAVRQARPAAPAVDVDAGLKALFEREADSRSVAQDAATLEAAIRLAEAARPLETERRRLEAALGYGFPFAA